MKKNKIVKKLFYSSLSLSILSVGSLSAVSAVLNKENTNAPSAYNYSKTLNADYSKTLNADTVNNRALTTNNNNGQKDSQRLISYNRNGSNGTDFSDDLAKQYKATDSSGTSYAVLTTSTASGGMSAKHDGITKYSLSGTNPGKADWLVKYEDLRTVAMNGGAPATLNITSIKYSSGNFGSSGSLFVLGNDGSTKSYLFRIVWNGFEMG